MGASSSSEEELKHEEETRAQVRANEEQRKKDLEENERFEEQIRQLNAKQKLERQKIMEVAQQDIDTLKMVIQKRELENHLASLAAQDRIQRELNDHVLQVIEEYEGRKEDMREEQQHLLRRAQNFHSCALEVKRHDIQLAEGQLAIEIRAMKEMTQQAKEEHRSEIAIHKLRKRDAIEDYHEQISTGTCINSVLEEDTQRQMFTHKSERERIERKTELDKANLDKAIRSDMLEKQFNQAVRRAKSAGSSLSDAMEILNESINNLQAGNGEALTNVRNRRIGISRVKHELTSLTEAAEDILKFKEIDVVEDSTNKEIAQGILRELNGAKDCLIQFVNSYEDKDVLIKNYREFKDKIYFLSSLASNIFLEIDLHEHAVKVINENLLHF